MTTQLGTATADAHDARRRPATRSTTAAAVRPSSKRSPSPIVKFTSTPLPVDSAKGVQDITRKVLRQLEGLGHLEVVEMETPHELSEDEQPLHNGNGVHVQPNGAVNPKPSTNGHTHSNGNGALKPVEKPVDYEIPRKLLHGSIGFFVLYLYLSGGNPRNVIVALWSALCVIYPADLLRFRSRRFARLYESLLGFLMRESEKDSVNGVVWYILGVNTVLSSLPLDVASVSILILSWADTTASTFGRLYGRRTAKLPARSPVLGLPLAPRKSVAGFIAASVTGALITFGFWGWIAPMREEGLTWTWDGGIRNAGAGGLLGLSMIAVVAGLVTGVAEALDLGSVDDNLSLPIIAGGCIAGFFKLFEYASSTVSSWVS
ncbi:hypothetical protein CC2G_015177 [Coprinopsis cinerea AmutBmut pab1-1]|nr:hypothetical protein CC2G_015177 [Coprinopsis cinerea AmutBmut pab1-1]